MGKLNCEPLIQPDLYLLCWKHNNHSGRSAHISLLFLSHFVAIAAGWFQDPAMDNGVELYFRGIHTMLRWLKQHQWIKLTTSLFLQIGNGKIIHYLKRGIGSHLMGITHDVQHMKGEIRSPKNVLNTLA